MKRKTAKEILADTFRELSENTPIDKITVKDITENSGYSTATFYRQFKDKYDLIAWGYSRDLEKIMVPFGKDRSLWKKTLSDAAEYYNRNKTYLANLLLHTSGYDSFLRYMTEIHIESLSECLKDPSGCQAGDDHAEMYVRIFCMGTVSFTCEWILGKHDLTVQELTEVYQNALPEALRRSLAIEG